MESKTLGSNTDLVSLAKDVLRNYDIVPDSITVIQSGTIKTVWRLKSKNRVLCLKRLKQSHDKALFSVNAQIYIKDSNGNVPSIIKDKSGIPIVQHNNELFVLYEWLEGRDLNFKQKEDLNSALHGLAKFHISSRGYTASENARISSKIAKWPEQYNSMKSKFLEWKEVSRKNSSLSFHSTYLKYADSMADIANIALEYLDKSAYNELTSSNSQSHVLCHQDYGKGNAVLTDKGVFVLDLDGVTYDLPARDLRKIIGKLAENRGSWDTELIIGVLDAYTKVNPLSDKEKEILYIDLLFPHWFFGLVKNLFKNNKPIKSTEIERIAKLEQSKVAILKSLLKKR